MSGRLLQVDSGVDEGFHEKRAQLVAPLPHDG